MGGAQGGDIAAGAGTDDGQVKLGIDWGIAHAGNLAGGGASGNPFVGSGSGVVCGR
jgi:hypothetical protein